MGFCIEIVTSFIVLLGLGIEVVTSFIVQFICDITGICLPS